MTSRAESSQVFEFSHYIGQSGVEYYAYQSRFGDIAQKLVASKFVNHIRPSDVILDFGCGGGFILSALTCAQRLGIDINPVAREAAASRGITCFESLDVIPDETVDVVIANHSLEHVPSPLHTLRDLQSKLRPGGRLLIVVPIDDWRVQRKYDPTDINHHLYTWTPLLLGHLLYEAGFDTTTFSTNIGINGWFRAFPKLYGKLPRPFLQLLLSSWCAVRRTREIYGIVCKPACKNDAA